MSNVIGQQLRGYGQYLMDKNGVTVVDPCPAITYAEAKRNIEIEFELEYGQKLLQAHNQTIENAIRSTYGLTDIAAVREKLQTHIIGGIRH